MVKYLLAFFLVLLVCGLFFLERKYSPVEGLTEGPPSFLRLHILANSNEDSDQNIKLKVRDLVLVKLYHDFQGLTNSEEAIKYTGNNLGVLKNKINKYLKEHGFSYKAQCALVRENFKPSTYGAFQLPGGEYRALRITLGEGTGKNWWCVLYPPLCFYELNDGEALSVIRQDDRQNKPNENKEEGSFLRDIYQNKILKVWITQ